VPSYDAIAEQYAVQYFDELDDDPLDREVLDRFAVSVRGRGHVCDLGWAIFARSTRRLPVTAQ
jgi:hypothetical protein